MAFFTGWAAKFGDAFVGLFPGAHAVLLRKSDDSLDMLASDDAGAAKVSIAGGLALIATAALQSALNSLVATPTTPTAITKSDSTDTTTITAKGILVGGAGNVVVRGVGSTTDVTIAAVAGQYIPLQASRVMAATTATGLVGLS